MSGREETAIVLSKAVPTQGQMQSEETLLWPGLGQGQLTQGKTDVDRPYSVWLPLPLLSSPGAQVTGLAFPRAFSHGATSTEGDTASFSQDFM